MKKIACVFLAFFLMLTLNAQKTINYVVLFNDKWPNIQSVVDVFIENKDSNCCSHGSVGTFHIDTINSLSSTIYLKEESIIVINVAFGCEGDMDSLKVDIKKEELFNAHTLILNINSKGRQYDIKYEIFRCDVNDNLLKHLVFFAIDGKICYEVDSVLFCDDIDTFQLLYDCGMLYFDSISFVLCHNYQTHGKNTPCLLIYISNRCYKIPIHNLSNDTWYIFIRNISRKKYSTGWYDGYRLRYKKIADLYGRFGAFYRKYNFCRFATK